MCQSPPPSAALLILRCRSALVLTSVLLLCASPFPALVTARRVIGPIVATSARRRVIRYDAARSEQRPFNLHQTTHAAGPIECRADHSPMCSVRLFFASLKTPACPVKAAQLSATHMHSSAAAPCLEALYGTNTKEAHARCPLSVAILSSGGRPAGGAPAPSAGAREERTRSVEHVDAIGGRARESLVPSLELMSFVCSRPLLHSSRSRSPRRDRGRSRSRSRSRGRDAEAAPAESAPTESAPAAEATEAAPAE
jgi:hypothetical protein